MLNAQRLERLPENTVIRDNNDRDPGCLGVLLEFLVNINAIHDRHDDVQNNKIDLDGLNDAPGLAPVLGRLNSVTMLLEFCRARATTVGSSSAIRIRLAISGTPFKTVKFNYIPIPLLAERDKFALLSYVIPLEAGRHNLSAHLF